MGSLSIVHWMIVLAIVLLFFGPNRLPSLAKSLGESIREFKKAVKDNDSPQAQQLTPKDPPKLVSTDTSSQPSSTEKPTDHDHKA